MDAVKRVTVLDVYVLLFLMKYNMCWKDNVQNDLELYLMHTEPTTV